VGAYRCQQCLVGFLRWIKQGYDIMLQEKAMEEEERRIAEYGNQY
jgi:hypothetical protein